MSLKVDLSDLGGLSLGQDSSLATMSQTQKNFSVDEPEAYALKQPEKNATEITQ